MASKKSRKTKSKVEKIWNKFWEKPKAWHIQFLIALVLLLTMFISLMGYQDNSTTQKELRYLNYPHLRVGVTCPKEMDNYNRVEVITSITNLGKYGEYYVLRLNASDNLKFKLDDEYKNKTGYMIIIGDQTIQHKIVLYPDVKTTENFTLIGNYSCNSFLKPCDFWTLTNFTCPYEKTETSGTYAKWRLR